MVSTNRFSSDRLFCAACLISSADLAANSLADFGWRVGIRPLMSNIRMPKYAAMSNTMTAKPPLINERMAQPHGREGLENGGGDGGIGIMKDLESHFEIQVQTTWENSVGVIDGVWVEYLKNKKHR